MPIVPRTRRDGEVPPLLEQAAADARDALTDLINSREVETARVHAELFRQYRDELERAFAAYMLVATPGGQPRPAPVWDGLRLRQDGREAELVESFRALIDAMREVDTDAFTDMLSEAADDGFDRALYMMALGGLDTAELLDRLPDDWETTLRDAGYDEVDWEQRLGFWGTDTSEKLRRWLTGTAVAGLPLTDTVNGYAAITSGHTGHVEGLLGNELARAFGIGALLAMTLARETFGDDAFVEVWLAKTDASGRPDPLVCPVCAALHMTVTTKQPVDDTHPGCRCVRVPVPANFTPVPGLSFESFRQGGGR